MVNEEVEPTTALGENLEAPVDPIVDHVEEVLHANEAIPIDEVTIEANNNVVSTPDEEREAP